MWSHTLLVALKSNAEISTARLASSGKLTQYYDV
jgi:hypothetical protein